jgi:hypothetical protein
MNITIAVILSNAKAFAYINQNQFSLSMAAPGNKLTVHVT